MESTMTLLENIYHQLHDSRLVKNREHFSTKYLGKSKNWYSAQKHERRDFSISTAIVFLSNIHTQVLSREISTSQKQTLIKAEKALLNFVANKLNIHPLYTESASFKNLSG